MTLGLEGQLLIENKKNARTTSTSWTAIFIAEQVVCGFLIFFPAGINAKHSHWGGIIMKGCFWVPAKLSQIRSPRSKFSFVIDRPSSFGSASVACILHLL